MLKFALPTRCGSLSLQRLYSTGPAKTRVQLVGELRKLTSAPISKARQALDESNGDLDAAIQWLEKDMRTSGAAKAEKVKDRAASEGLISVSLLSGGKGSPIGSAVKASMIELSCESDFVSRTEEFARLAAEISQTIAHSTSQEGTTSPFVPLPVESLLQLSHKEGTVGSAITDLIAKIGENILLRRATLLTPPKNSNSVLRATAYVHGSTPEFPSQGRVGALELLALRPPQSHVLQEESFLGDLEKLERALARQTAGFETLGIDNRLNPEDELETVLYEQPFMMLGGENASLPVRQVMDQWQEKWGLEEFAVTDFARWEVGRS